MVKTIMYLKHFILGFLVMTFSFKSIMLPLIRNTKVPE